MNEGRRKIVLIDFDGTLNSYKTKFDRNRPELLPDPPLPGAIAFMRRMCASGVYQPVIFTTRVAMEDDLEPGGAAFRDSPTVQRAIRAWLIEYGLEPVAAQSVRVTCHKVPCSLIIDDNAFRFEGKYPSPTEMDALTVSKRPQQEKEKA